MEDIFQCYKVLDLEPGAAAEQVRKSYIELAHVWDPDRYLSNAVLRERAQIKRREIDQAYSAIRAFLPELQGPTGDLTTPPEISRDYTELSTRAPLESSKAILGIIVAVCVGLILSLAYYVLVKSRAQYPAADSLSIEKEINEK